MTSKQALNNALFDYSMCDVKTHSVKKQLEINEGLNELEKDVEVMEILKSKRVDISRLDFAPRVEVYNSYPYYKNATELHLTQEEFYLIKEWLKR